MPRRLPSSRRSSPTTGGIAVAQSPELSAPLVTACAVALWFARWLVPAESATQGETLWITAGWLALAAAYAYGKFRDAAPLKLTLWDVGLGVIVLGQCIGAANVWVNGGNLRAAVNGGWEWIGLFVSTSLMLRLLHGSAERTRFVAVMMTLLVVLAGLGLWQHYIWYPQTAAQYRELVVELDRDISPLRRREIESELAQAGFPVERQARLAFEQRLFSSTEPIGFFALTNTLAGLLAVGTIIGAFGVVAGFVRSRSPPRRVWMAAAGGTVVIALCLLLTKSRTAWVGTAAAFTVGGLHLMRTLQISRTTWLRGGGALAATIVVGAVGLVLSGGLDRQVVSEAPKSLRYRLEYWTGTRQVIRDHPFAGVGPGNFRPHYLQHKLPQSSEEIADPHQMVLDLWVHGGIVSLLGLGVLAFVVVRAIRSSTEPIETDAETPAESSLTSPWTWGGVGSFVLVMLVQFVSGEPYDARLLVCGLAFAGLLFVGFKAVSSRFASRMVLGLASLALAIHLQGAGGISMPAVAQLMFLLPGLVFALDSRTVPVDEKPESKRRWLAVAVLTLIGLIGCLTTALLPTWQSRLLLVQGDGVLFAGQSPTIAENFYRRAAEADEWSPEPHERLAQLAFNRWSSGLDADENAFEVSEAAMREAIARDPFDHNHFETLGRWSLDRFERTGDVAHAETAAERYGEAVRRYPAHAELQWFLATSLQAAGRTDEATTVARRAAELDEINRRYTHTDKYLTKEQLESLQPLLKAATDR